MFFPALFVQPPLVKILDPVVSVSSQSPSRIAAGAPQSITVTVKRNGDITIEGVDQTDEWIPEGDKTATIGDDYEVRLTELSPTGVTVTSGPTRGVYHALTSDRSWVFTRPFSGEGTWTGNLSVRNASQTINADSGTYTVTIEVL